ncbi:MAG: 2-oxoacid:acceptor oxidoreductase family protein [Candidatus Bipolaricaulota bacterium]|nr:2-oxoacid:acceptor oxidoreductase family protein [Candidatus Bipolaricaulota bacterium]
MIEIRWHGRGGQGAKTVSQILAGAALRRGHYVQAFPEYGPERSGAPVKAFTRLNTKEIRLHCSVYEPDIVVVLDPTLLHAKEVRVTEGLKRQGVLLVNTPHSPEEIRQQTGFMGKIITLDAEALARSVGARFSNVVMLGALARLLGDISLEDVEREFAQTFGEKALATNVAALRAGFSALEAPL